MEGLRFFYILDISINCQIFKATTLGNIYILQFFIKILF